MDGHDWLVEQFEANRTRLRAVALPHVGSLNEADDAVQEPGFGSAAPLPMASRTSAHG